MPISTDRANKLQGLKKLEIPFEDGELNIIYTRDKYTPKLEREMRQMMDDDMPANSLAKYLVGLVTDWDLFYFVDSNGVIVEEEVATGKALPQREDAVTFEPLGIGDEDVIDAEFTEISVEEIATKSGEGKSAKKIRDAEEKREEKAPVIEQVLPISTTGIMPYAEEAAIEAYIPVGPFKRRKLPFNEQNLAAFGISFITRIIEEIAKDQRPNRNPSASTSDTF